MTQHTGTITKLQQEDNEVYIIGWWDHFEKWLAPVVVCGFMFFLMLYKLWL